MTVHHHILLDGQQRRWPVDPRAVWDGRASETLALDLTGMSTYFPHWVLVGCRGGTPARCPDCGIVIVPTEGTVRCAKCGGPGRADALLWLGHLPALARPEPEFQLRYEALRRAGFAEVTVGEDVYLLVPLQVLYPDEWPNVEPVVRYAPRWLDALGLPGSSAAHHLVQGGRACIFGWGQWTVMPLHVVLQQRVVNHVASLLKVAAGQKPEQAFIGRGHHTAGLAG